MDHVYRDGVVSTLRVFNFLDRLCDIVFGGCLLRLCIRQMAFCHFEVVNCLLQWIIVERFGILNHKLSPEDLRREALNM